MTRDVSIQPSLWVEHYCSCCLGFNAEREVHRSHGYIRHVRMKFLLSGSTSVKHFLSLLLKVSHLLVVSVSIRVSFNQFVSLSIGDFLSLSLFVSFAFIFSVDSTENSFNRLMNRLLFLMMSGQTWYCPLDPACCPTFPQVRLGKFSYVTSPHFPIPFLF